MADLGAGPVVFEGAEVLQATFEMAYSAREITLPAGLHPTSPPLMVVLAWSAPAGPWGPFSMAQVRVSCRSGVRPRGFVAGCVTDRRAAAEGLRSTWGLPAELGEVVLARRYDSVDLSVESAAGPAMVFRGLDPDPLAPGDVQYTVTTTLAHTPRGLRLVQVDTDYDLRRVERVRPRLEHFAADAWGSPHLAPRQAVSATIGLGDITVPPLRFLTRPDVSAFEGTEPV